MIFDKLLDSSYFTRYVLLNSVGILDYKVFPAREILNSPPVFHFTRPENPMTLASLDKFVPVDRGQVPTQSIDQFLESKGTAAFLVVKGNELLFEKYYHGYDHSSVCTSFSVAKSFASALIGIALKERLIGSLDDPITRYLPGLTADYWSQITVRHLVSMTSGLKYDGGFFPWSDNPKVYYSLDLRQLAGLAQKGEGPGNRFHYNNYNLVLLGMVIEQATGSTVSAYLQEKIWGPLGMEYPATWSLDSRKSGMEKMESGLNARAIDFAKFGRLYLNRGAWNGKQIIPEEWVVESTTAGPDAKWTNYKYLWWIVQSGKGRFMAVGNLGQFIYVAPDKDCVILRFGEGKPRNWRIVYVKLFNTLADSV